MKIPANGSKWEGQTHRDAFRVIHTIELDGHTWVHYREESNDKEYSCYLESFLSRFREVAS